MADSELIDNIVSNEVLVIKKTTSVISLIILIATPLTLSSKPSYADTNSAIHESSSNKPLIEHVSGLWVPLLKIKADETPAISAPNVTIPLVAEVIKPIQWTATSGAGLHVTLQNWADKSGWKLSWEIGPDMVVMTDASFTGDFSSVVKEFITSINDSNELQIHAKFFDGNNVLRIYKEI